MEGAERGADHSHYPEPFEGCPSLDKEKLQQYFERSNILICKAAQGVKNVIEEQCTFPSKRQLYTCSSSEEGCLEHVEKRKRTDIKSDIDTTANAVYEQSVAIYRKLRNDIPFLTDAAYDIDAAGEAAKSAENGDIPTELGPLVKRAPPGRGRRKRLSIVNTPLPAQVLKMLQKQRCHQNPMGHPYQPIQMHRPLRVLFVDDSLVTLKLTAQRLQRSGIAVDYTTEANEALARLDQIMCSGSPPYDIFLTDLNMPQMSGPDLAREFRKMEETYRLSSGVSKRQLLIGTSTDTDKKSSNLALSSGMDVFLGKPFTPSDIWLFVSVATDGASSDRGGGGGNEGSVVEQKEESDVSIGSGSFISLPLSGFTDAETLHLRDADQVEEVNDEGN